MKKQNYSYYTKAGWLLFYLYIILLSYFLFFSEHYGRDCISEDYRYNLEFMKEIIRFIQYRDKVGLESFVVNILGNILAFTPFGFLLPMLSAKYRQFFFVAFLSLLFSLLVETIQMLFRVGIFDVDDLFLNTIGGILGYVFYLIIRMILKPRNKKSRGK